MKMVAHNVECAWNCGRDSEFGIWRNGVLVGLCFYCKINLFAVQGHDEGTAELIVCPTQGVARVDGGRWGGGVGCEGCGRLLYDHPDDQDHPFLTVHCDGRLVKL